MVCFVVFGGFGGPGGGFGGPGGGLNGNRSSGKPLLLLRLKKPPPGRQKPVPGPPGPPRDSLSAPPGTIIDRLGVHRSVENPTANS